MRHLQSSIDKFTSSAKSQEDKGIEKYGQPLDPLDDYDWLEMAIEEQVDGFKYLHAEQIKRQWAISNIRRTLSADDLNLDEMINSIEYYLTKLANK